MHRQVADLQDNYGAVAVGNTEAVPVAVGNTEAVPVAVDNIDIVLLVVGNTDIAGDTAVDVAPSDTED